MTLADQAVAWRDPGLGGIRAGHASSRRTSPSRTSISPRSTPTAWPPTTRPCSAPCSAATTATSCSTATTSARSGCSWCRPAGGASRPRRSCRRCKAPRPSTSEPARILSRLRTAVAESGTTPATLDDVRALSPEASPPSSTGYLRYRGALVFSRYDIDGVTLGELPDVVLATILEGRKPRGTHDPEAAGRRAAGPCAREPTGPSSTTCSPRPASP